MIDIHVHAFKSIHVETDPAERFTWIVLTIDGEDRLHLCLHFDGHAEAAARLQKGVNDD